MSRKDFELIARTLREVRPDEKGLPARLELWRETVEAFAKALPAVNARFNADRFKRACGLTE